MPRWSSLLSVGCATALGWTVVSMVTRRRCRSSTAPPRCAAVRLSASSASSRSGRGAGATASSTSGPAEGRVGRRSRRRRVARRGCPGSARRPPRRTTRPCAWQVQADHQPRRQAGPAALRVERPELRLEPAPVDQPCQAHQRVPRVDQVLQPRSEEVVLRRRRGLLRTHPRTPCRAVADQSRPLPPRNAQLSLQGSHPRSGANLQNRILPEHQKTAERRDAQPISRATR